MLFRSHNFNRMKTAADASAKADMFTADWRAVCSTPSANINAVEIKPYEPGKINAFTSALTAVHTKIHTNTRFILSENKKYKQIGQNR